MYLYIKINIILHFRLFGGWDNKRYIQLGYTKPANNTHGIYMSMVHNKNDPIEEHNLCENNEHPSQPSSAYLTCYTVANEYTDYCNSKCESF